MRRVLIAAAAAVTLAAPTVLAFFSGGYFAEPRLVAGLAVWTLVLLLALAGTAPLPRGRAGWLALGGLAALTAWSALSIAWAPLGGPAAAAVQRLVLYTGALALALAALRHAAVLRAVEPSLAAGATLVVGYGLAGRVLPGILELARSESAGGRLEQPITYWNAEGALAAVGLVLCARIAGDPARPVPLRALAAAAAAPLGAGVYLSFSRGAIAVAALGLVVLVVLTGSHAQLRASVSAAVVGVLAGIATGVLPGVASLSGTLDDRIRDGAIALVLLVLLAATAALAALRGPRAGPADDALPWARRVGRIATVVWVLGAVGLIAGGLAERPTEAELAAGARAERLTTVSSNRYEYWRVGVGAFADNPLNGLGAGGFRVEWLRERPIPEAVRDVHSIALEQATELGLVGLAAFAALLAGALMAAAGALRRDTPAAAGACAAVLAWLLHAAIDWDWQLPAVSLPAIVLTGALIVISERAP